MKRKVTIQDIANMVNVSKSSVSRYLKNGYISEENAIKMRDFCRKAIIFFLLSADKILTLHLYN